MRDLMFEPKIEVLSAADGVRRRHWDDADKVRIVEESLRGHLPGLRADLPDTKVSRVPELLPWNWTAQSAQSRKAA
ncbi:hypothetical protein [Poseidonocella sp. HB161398]|uniref:hypothetical protein n=1 Tax=Poseidonocella sp. HB161398 TaxID=2320855 RepID=UPI001F10F9E7|nr:hypothetical protein [Poseidonocella sp. HB161398]